MVEPYYAILEKILLKSPCQVKDSQGKISDAYACRLMVLGSFISELTDLGLYPQQKTGTTLEMSVATLQAHLETFQISTYDTHNYAEMAKYDEHVEHTKKPNPFDYTLSVSSTSNPRDRKYYLGHGIVSHARCAETLNLSGLPAKVVSKMPSPVLESHRRHMELQAKK